MAESNFQDIVVLSSGTLQLRAQAMSVGTDAGAKSVVLANDVGAIHLNANPSAGAKSILLPDASGTVGLITALSAGTTLVSGGQVVFSNSNNFSFGLSGSTITASFNAAAAAFGGIAAGTQTATTGTVNFANSNGVTFGMSGSSQVTASFAHRAYALYLAGI